MTRFRQLLPTVSFLFAMWAIHCQNASVSSAPMQPGSSASIAAAGIGTAPALQSIDSIPPRHLLPPLQGYPWLMDLGEGEHIQDVVTPPLGATERRPVVVAVHGAGDRPDWACGGWRIGMEAYPFIACPAGLRMSRDTFGWGGTHTIQAAVERTLGALHRTFASYISDVPMVYAGFSQGATLAAPFLIANAKRFPVAALAEGGYDYLSNARFAHDYRAAGGQRIMLLCGTTPCFTAARRAKVTLERAGLFVIVAGDSLSGHNLNARMQDALRRDWSKLIDALPGWESFGLHRWPPPAAADPSRR